MSNKTPVYNCVKCGAVNEMIGMQAENKAMASAKVRMIRCVCSKCGFIEFRMNQADFANVMDAKAEKES